MGTMQFGVHYMLDGYNANPSLLMDVAVLKNVLELVPKEMSMHPITKPVVVEVGPNNKKDPGGISGFVMIAESHISIHTFPNRCFVTIDVYTCQDEIDSESLTKHFTQAFGIKNTDVQVIPRGVRYPKVDMAV